MTRSAYPGEFPSRSPLARPGPVREPFHPAVRDAVHAAGDHGGAGGIALDGIGDAARGGEGVLPLRADLVHPGGVTADLGRVPLEGRLRFVGRALVRRVPG